MVREFRANSVLDPCIGDEVGTIRRASAPWHP